jgi:transcriptional regulator with XRE-family HTH domain
MPTVGNVIRSARKDKRLSQGALAQLVGVTRVAVSEWERDVSLPRVKTARKIAGVLDISPAALTPLSQAGVRPYHHNELQHPYVQWDDLPKLATEKSSDPAALETFKLTLTSASMSPVMNAGDVVTVDPLETAWDGCYVIAMTADGSVGMLRNYRIRQFGGCDLWANNPAFGTETLVDDGANRIIGVVVAHERRITRD